MTKKWVTVARVIGLGADDHFEVSEGSTNLLIEHMDALETKLNDHDSAASDWMTEKTKLEAAHKIALDAATQKLATINTKVGELTTELATAKETIKTFEDEPADKTNILNLGNHGGKKKDAFSYSEQRFNKKK